jgi:FtsH-binding integral membrane protein
LIIKRFDLPNGVVVSFVRFYRIKPVFLAYFCLKQSKAKSVLSIRKLRKIMFQERGAYDPNVRTRSFIDSGRANEFMRLVYAVMAIGLAITGLTAWYFGTGLAECIQDGYLMPGCKYDWLIMGPMRWVVMLAPLAGVLALSFGINKMSYSTASLVFGVYSFLMGLSLSYIFVIYTGGSIFKTFFITAGTFGAMSIIGMTTKIDLTKFRSILFMGLIGIIIASVVNMFMRSEMFDYIISFIGIGVFCGLTAYDTQRLLQIGAHADTEQEGIRKVALMGALNLYLDFVNLFLFLLRFFGASND